MGGIITVITASNPFANFGIATPGVLTWAHGNKLSACMMLFMVGNMVSFSLLITEYLSQ